VSLYIGFFRSLFLVSALTSIFLQVCLVRRPILPVLFIRPRTLPHVSTSISSWLVHWYHYLGPAHLYPHFHSLLLPLLKGITIQNGFAAHFKRPVLCLSTSWHQKSFYGRLSCSQCNLQKSNYKVRVRPNSGSPFYTHLLQWCSPSLYLIDLVFSHSIWG